MEEEKNTAGDRLNRVLAACGLGSRRHCESLILAGVVTIDGKKVTDLGTRVDLSKQELRVDGEVIQAQKKAYYLLHKPIGVYCTNSPQEKRTRAIDLINDPRAGRLFCVGRLDADSEGLIILTNDGDFANRMTHPRYGVAKTYFVKVRGKPSPAVLQKAQRGVHLAEGKTGPMKIMVRKSSQKFSNLLVTIHEGKNREIRRVFGRLGLAVIELKRVSIGHIRIENLPRGHFRHLTSREIRELLAGATPKPRIIPVPDRKPFHRPR